MITPCGRSSAWSRAARRRKPPPRDAPERAPAVVAAVLCDGALPVQLSAGAAGALAGGHAEPLDPRRRLLGAGGQRVPAQRHVHLSALLRQLPRLRAAARAGAAVRAVAQPTSGVEGARQPA